MKSSMKFLSICLVAINYAIAMPSDEALVASAYTQGVNIYNSCIAIPPANPNALAYCTTLYVTYLSSLTIINAPFPTILSLDPSPYSWSPFDICRYEVAHMIFNSVIQSPYYCPTI